MTVVVRFPDGDPLVADPVGRVFDFQAVIPTFCGLPTKCNNIAGPANSGPSQEPAVGRTNSGVGANPVHLDEVDLEPARIGSGYGVPRKRLAPKLAAAVGPSRKVRSSGTVRMPGRALLDRLY